MSTIPSYLQSLEAVLNGSSASPALLPTSVLQQPAALLPTSVLQQPAAPQPAAPQLPSFLTSSQLSAGLTTSNSGSTDGKIKLLLVGTHAHQFTGYSKVTYGFLKVLAKQKNLAITHFGFQRNPSLPPNYRPYPPSIRVLDAADMEAKSTPPGTNPPPQGFGFNILPDVIRQEKPNVVMIYNDMAVISRFLEEIRKSGIPRTFKIWLYVDQVYNTQLQAHLDIINRDGDRVFAFTKYWKQCLKDQGITRPLDVLGHGFDREIFNTMDRVEVRKKLNLPTDAFMVVSLNRNQPRKRYDLLIMAFTELIVKYPTKPIFMMCVCDKGEKGGWWLFELFARELKLRSAPMERFGNRLLLTNQDMAFRDEDINMFYNLADVGISTADGEGWGLCNFEQMGVGVPQVVPDIGGFKDFCNKENSVLVKPKHRQYLPGAYSPVGGECEICDPHDICVGIEEYLMDSEKRKKHGVEAKKTVLAYTWEKATEPLIKRLNQELEAMKEED
jgi:glycosyltransferase involved in cell wall biosynthesis